MGVVLVVLLLLSAWQVSGFVQFSSMASAIRDDEQTARVNSEALRTELTSLESKLDRPESSAKLNEIGFLNELIARREFSWTRMFGNFERMIPADVRLVSVTPEVTGAGPVLLRMEARGRSIADITALISVLEKSTVFGKVAVSVEEKNNPSAAGDVQVTLSASYYPEREPK